MAFIGVVFGLFFSANPISLFTLYGTVALAGIAANDAIVLMSTANRSLDRGCTTPLAIVRAARRRFVPILITSITTMLGLFSLATGLGGESLTWGPVATAIVWGLGFSTLLTLFVVPLTFLIFVPARAKQVLIPLPGDATGKLLTMSNQLKSKLGLALRSEDTALNDMLAKEDYKARYESGIADLRGDATGDAIKCFEYLAEKEPDVGAFNLLAAQALVRHMQVFEWDVGYRMRLERYLNRAKALGATDNIVVVLERACAELDKSNEEML